MGVHIHTSGKLAELVQENARIQTDMDRLKAELGDYDRVKAQREELLKQRKSIQALEAGRTGPVFLLRELSEILTPGKGPTFDRVSYEEALRRDPNVGFNAAWDTRRAWLESYEEHDKKVRIRGAAKSHDDAAEFMKRLNSSVFFNGVRLENTGSPSGGLRARPPYHLQPQRRGDLLMNELISKLMKLKPPQKAGLTAIAVAVIAGLYYQFFYADLSDGIAAAEANRARLSEERAGYEKRKVEYLAYRNELVQLQEEQRELLRVLPKRDEIASFLASIQEQGELSGLEVISFNVENEVQDELYIKIPVRMEVRGGFHAVTKFFKSVSELRRIVTVEELALIPEKETPRGGGAPTKLKARFIAATYRYQDANEKGAGGGT